MTAEKVNDDRHFFFSLWPSHSEVYPRQGRARSRGLDRMRLDSWNFRLRGGLMGPRQSSVQLITDMIFQGNETLWTL